MDPAVLRMDPALFNWGLRTVRKSAGRWLPTANYTQYAARRAGASCIEMT
jgi:hypothetical protein